MKPPLHYSYHFSTRYRASAHSATKFLALPLPWQWARSLDVTLWLLTAYIRYWRPFVTSAPLSRMPVHAEPLHMCTNVVYFRVMRRLYHCEWNWLCVNQQTRTTDKGSRRVTSYSKSPTAYCYLIICVIIWVSHHKECHSQFQEQSPKFLGIQSWYWHEINKNSSVSKVDVITRNLQEFLWIQCWIGNIQQYAVGVWRHSPWPLVCCHGCWFAHSQFHSGQYSLCITLKYTTLVNMRSGSAWTGIHDNGAEWRTTSNSIS